MGAYIEPLILYMVLFLPVLPGQPPEGTVPFSIQTELARIFLFNLPALALIWHLLLKQKSLRRWKVGWPGLKDILPAALAFPGLLLSGLAISFVSARFSGIPGGTAVSPPSGWLSWLILVPSCLSTGYLEESFFRFYLLSKRDDLGLGPIKAVLLSTLLFSACHIYEGPWGFFNAVLSGILLSFIFLRYRSLHGIAFAHSLYNVFVYVMSAF